MDPIEKAEKDFFKIVEEEKSKRKKKMVDLDDNVPSNSTDQSDSQN